ncbi:hypothetical protein [Mucisphaera sp.]|uniref:hypothetical protein n=1 Tax=Mucisphaera sp. TaxID=2913024 RepID=UPI003D10E2CC
MKTTSLALTAALLLVLVCLTPLAVTKAEPVQRPIQGLWVWHHEWYVDDAYRAEMFRFAQEHGYNLLMVQVHLDESSGRPELAYPNEFRTLIIEAAELGISVEALDGEKDMAMQRNWPRTFAILDLILDFNASLPEGSKLAGIHYDIEPYIKPEWRESQAVRDQIMLDLLAYFDQAKARIEASQQNLTLAADIPFWYDSKTEEGDSCIITYRGETKNLHKHIQDICDYIGIMSYRQRAVGPNSVTSVVENELAYAEEIGKFILASLETVELTDTPQITFYGMSPEAFWNTHHEVVRTLEGRPGFGGMLSHSYRGMRDLHGMSPFQRQH